MPWMLDHIERPTRSASAWAMVPCSMHATTSWRRPANPAYEVRRPSSSRSSFSCVPSSASCATLKHMAEVGIRALKQNASAVVANAASGETITITDRGRPVAQMTRIPSSRIQGLVDSGRGRRARRNITTLSTPTTGPNLSGELAAMRDEERY